MANGERNLHRKRQAKAKKYLRTRRYIHVSARLGTVPQKDGTNLTVVMKPGSTYHVGG